MVSHDFLVESFAQSKLRGGKTLRNSTAANDELRDRKTN